MHVLYIYPIFPISFFSFFFYIPIFPPKFLYFGENKSYLSRIIVVLVFQTNCFLTPHNLETARKVKSIKIVVIDSYVFLCFCSYIPKQKYFYFCEK